MNNTNKVLIGLIVIMASVLIVFLVLIFKEKTKQPITPNQQQVSNPNQQQVSKEKKYPSDLQGKVYLSLKNKKTGIVGVYFFDLDKNSLEEVESSSECTIIGGEVKNDKMLVSSNCDSENPDVYQIYSDNIKNGGVPITNTPSKFKKEAVWSNDGSKIAFMTNLDNENFSTDFSTKEWMIVVSDLSGNEKLSFNGVLHPFFSPDNNITLASMNHGLVLFDIEKNMVKSIFDFGDKVSAATQIDLSDKKDLLAISNSITNEITIFKINSWDVFEMEEIAKIPVTNAYASWPKFAPNDDNYLIVEELLDNGDIELIAYDLKTKKRHLIFNLNDYEHGELWINDWK